jgi:sugar lactone lactonase YvrE
MPGEIHPWKGYSPQNFVKPVAIACDPVSNVWVVDNGYSPALVQEFASGGVTFITQWYATSNTPKYPANCVANGMAVTVDGSGNDVVYVSDIANQTVNVYTANGILMRQWPNPHGYYEFQPFYPSCIAFDTAHNLVYVGDQNNSTIEFWNAP